MSIPSSSPEQQKISTFLRDLEKLRTQVPDFGVEVRKQVKGFTREELAELERQMRYEKIDVPALFAPSNSPERFMVLSAASERLRDLSAKVTTPWDRMADAILNTNDVPIPFTNKRMPLPIESGANLIASPTGMTVDSMTKGEKLVLLGASAVIVPAAAYATWKVITWPINKIASWFKGGKKDKHEDKEKDKDKDDKHDDGDDKDSHGGGLGKWLKRGVIAALIGGAGFLGWKVYNVAAEAGEMVGKAKEAAERAAQVVKDAEERLKKLEELAVAAGDDNKMSAARQTFALLEEDIIERKAGEALSARKFGLINMALSGLSNDAKREELLREWGIEAGKTRSITNAEWNHVLSYDSATKTLRVTESAVAPAKSPRGYVNLKDSVPGLVQLHDKELKDIEMHTQLDGGTALKPKAEVIAQVLNLPTVRALKYPELQSIANTLTLGALPDLGGLDEDRKLAVWFLAKTVLAELDAGKGGHLQGKIDPATLDSKTLIDILEQSGSLTRLISRAGSIDTNSRSSVAIGLEKAFASADYLRMEMSAPRTMDHLHGIAGAEHMKPDDDAAFARIMEDLGNERVADYSAALIDRVAGVTPEQKTIADTLLTSMMNKVKAQKAFILACVSTASPQMESALNEMNLLDVMQLYIALEETKSFDGNPPATFDKMQPIGRDLLHWKAIHLLSKKDTDLAQKAYLQFASI